MAYEGNKVETVGLKKLRANPKAELILCLNCKCSRYGTCGCMKKRS